MRCPFSSMENGVPRNKSSLDVSEFAGQQKATPEELAFCLCSLQYLLKKPGIHKLGLFPLSTFPLINEFEIYEDDILGRTVMANGGL